MSANVNLSEAQEIRIEINGMVAYLKKERDTKTITSRFEKVEQTIAQFRLACTHAIGSDFEFAIEKNIENYLWQTHVLINGEYRRVMGRLLAQGQVVVRRKVDKQYRSFLKVSQLFYRVYVQKLSSRFFIQELHDIALGTDIEPPDPPAPEATPPSPELRALIMKSCHTTLVHLGDLVRYRYQMLEKPSNTNTIFGSALEYYNLANAINPDDGSAHHQMAVLYQLQGQHLDIVYHFHRSVCIAKPHELGATNLDRAFKGLETPSAARKGAIKDPCETMVTWFLQLHTNFFKGEPFSQQAELEEEVLHRIEMTMKSDGGDAVLQKMILINIAAYDVALEKVNKNWSSEGSRSAQFLLRFNIRTILILLRVLKTALADENATFPAPKNEAGSRKDHESPICFSQILTKLLPFFRIYASWIYVSRADTNEYREFLEPYISDVYRLLADTFTLLNTALDGAAETVPSKYLLAEDTEVLGFRPFGDRKLPLFVCPEGVAASNSSKKHKLRKPRQRTYGYQYKPETEAIWRSRDIVYCGILLAGSSSYPLTLTVKHHQGRDVECWNHTDDATQRVSVDEANMSRMLKKLKLGSMKHKSEEAPVEKEPIRSNGDAKTDNPTQHHTNSNGANPGPQNRVDKGKAVEIQAPSSQLDEDLGGDLGEDIDVVDMVNKLLSPNNSRPQSRHTQDETSYGMDTTTANDVFGKFATTNSAQPSPASRTIPNLPWNYFYAPSPQRSGSQPKDTLASDGDFVPRSAYGQLDGFESSSYLNRLGTPALQPPTYHSPSQSQGTTAINNHPGRILSESLEVSRSSVLDTLNNALHAQMNPTMARPPSSYEDRMAASPALRHQTSNQRLSGAPYSSGASSPYLGHLNLNAGPSFMERSASQQTASSGLQSPPGSAGLGKATSFGGFPDSRSPFPTASSPAINGVGIPAQGAQARTRNNIASSPYQQHLSPWGQGPTRNGSSLAFSNTSSLFGGTPAVPAGGPSNSLYSNGNYYNASTPYGRLGPGQNNHDDPTHYKNQIRNILGEEDDSYDFDRQALYSALLNDQLKPSPPNPKQNHES
ncbi:hypothetical protein M426DRAFT_243703 [Hypoxylon sp. CI-4A]|nr:hypothetical protein M426DRAFT_243703 [Hypoxylon sp. CI-4A]